MLSVDLDICDVVLEDGWDVDLSELDKSEKEKDHQKIWMAAGWRERLTSGKVPLEKTLAEKSDSACTWKRRNNGGEEEEGQVDGGMVWIREYAYINRQVFPQAPSPTMTSLRRSSAMAAI